MTVHAQVALELQLIVNIANYGDNTNRTPATKTVRQTIGTNQRPIMICADTVDRHLRSHLSCKGTPKMALSVVENHTFL